MHKDPVLSAHHAGSNCFEIGGEYSPASIRDQMVRSYLVVQRAYEAGLIGPNRPLLVVGAGSSGLTAALHSAMMRVPTHVVDQNAGHQFRINLCVTRSVEATLYDWPASHWSHRKFPWAGVRMPLEWNSALASDVAIQWDRQFRPLKRLLGAFLHFDWGTKPDFSPDFVPPPLNAQKMVPVPLRKVGLTGPVTPVLFGALISCVGWGEERRDFHAIPLIELYRGYEFWESDPLQKPRCGLPTAPRILISGGGDGALQDLIRILTGRNTAQVFNGFLRAMRGHEALLALVTDVIRTAEDVARRSWSWNQDRHDDVTLANLEAAHEQALAMLKTSGAWPSIRADMERMLVSPVPDVQLMHSRQHFTQCYPLNRFLTLLLLEVAPMGTRRPLCEFERIEGTAHACDGVPGNCNGLDHTVDYKDNGTPRRDVYQVVVLRHGLKGPKRIFEGVDPVRVRQILPYYVEA